MIGGSLLVVVSLVLWVIEPETWPVTPAVALFFLAVAVVGAISEFGPRWAPATRSRLIGVGAVLMGLGGAAVAWAVWQHPGTFDDGPLWVGLLITLLALIFFGGGGLVLLRYGRPSAPGASSITALASGTAPSSASTQAGLTDPDRP